MKKSILLILFCNWLILFSQNDTTKSEERKWPDVKVSGYVKADYYYDTRQVVAFRADELHFYPKPIVKDDNGKDINARSSHMFVPFQSRLTVTADNIKIKNFDGKGIIEGEFFGHSENDLNEFRLRHAYFLLSKKQGFSFLMGQAWHPQFVEECFPTTASINTGIPFNPFARNPQLQIRYNIKKIQFLLAGVSQIDFTSTGPAGNSYVYIKNGNYPETVFRVLYKHENENNSTLVAGGSIAQKNLRPRTVSAKKINVNETITTNSASVFFKYSKKLLQIKFSSIVGEDMYHVSMLGGYAIRYPDFKVESNIYDYSLKYTPLLVHSHWIELIYGKTYQFGLFGGYTENLGSLQNIYNWQDEKSYFARGYNIRYVYRISPRLSLNIKNFTIGTEIENTIAAYGKNINSLGEVSNLYEVRNLRVLVYGFFRF